jgi:hypothetical protein
MKYSRVLVGRYALSVYVAGTLLAGCGGPQTQSLNAAPPLQSNAKLSSESLKHAAGGSFTASYAGTYERGCTLTGCSISLSGEGRGTFIGRSWLQGGANCRLHWGSGSGNFTFRSQNHLPDAFNASVNACLVNGKYNYTVHGGIGKFANASGGGTVSLSLSSGYNFGTFNSSWTGTLYY